MVGKFQFNELKAINALLFISSNIVSADIHKISKILYFADQKHLAKYGRPIIGGHYVAMPYGPVPSETYDLFKIVKEKREYKEYLNDYFDVERGHFIVPKIRFDEDEFSSSDLQCLKESIDENAALTFGKLSDKSHDSAWKAADSGDISFEDMAKVANASKGMIDYIKENSEYTLYRPDC